MLEQQMAVLIRRWVADTYGNSEVNNPSWDIKALARHITEALKGE